MIQHLDPRKLPRHLQRIVDAAAVADEEGSALEGERKQVTVLFADLKGSMELIADRDPEEARQAPRSRCSSG